MCLLTANTASFSAVISSALLTNGMLVPRAVSFVLDPTHVPRLRLLQLGGRKSGELISLFCAKTGMLARVLICNYHASA